LLDSGPSTVEQVWIWGLFELSYLWDESVGSELSKAVFRKSDRPLFSSFKLYFSQKNDSFRKHQSKI
jgi:hypothetical protein